jgi:hypothetical protein
VSPAPQAPAPPREGTSPAVERIVAVALAAMAAVLLLVWLDLLRTGGGAPPPPFDWTNPLLSAQPGDCVEVSDASMPGVRHRLVVRAPGVVLRPNDGPARIAGWTHPAYPDPRRFPPYLLADRRVPAPAEPGGGPPPADEPLVFPLNGFGMPLESRCALNEIEPQAIEWSGQRRRGFAVGLFRYGELEGPWAVYMTKDVPVLGTALRKYVSERGTVQQAFSAPEDCR